MSMEGVAQELRSLRRRLDAEHANAHTWLGKDDELAADLDRDDRRLVKRLRCSGSTRPRARDGKAFTVASSTALRSKGDHPPGVYVQAFRLARVPVDVEAGSV